MPGIVAMAKQWLLGDTTKDNVELTSHHIIESLLTEIRRLEAVIDKSSQETRQFRTEGVNELRRKVAEECAVLCETADYAVRSYGCSYEIRKRFGLPPPQKL